jgi:hypothetical protein
MDAELWWEDLLEKFPWKTERWEDNIKLDFMRMGCKCGILMEKGSGWCLMVEFGVRDVQLLSS